MNGRAARARIDGKVQRVKLAVYVLSSTISALAGVIANEYGVETLEGFTHFFEGWVIFVICIVILFGLAKLMLLFHPGRPSLADALDLETTGMFAQLGRIRLTQPSAAMISAAAIGFLALASWQLIPEARGVQTVRTPFAMFPQQLGDWRQSGPEERLSADIAKTLAADDYRQVTMLSGADVPPVGLFMAFYNDQSKGGVHSPEICLPSSGWEIAELNRIDIAPRLGVNEAFPINRAVIQNGNSRMMVYYWFQQGERRVAWDLAAKFYLLIDGIGRGQTDGGIVRLTTPIRGNESDDAAEARLMDMTRNLLDPLPRFFPVD
ncbi:MAG: exosortase C-terminal domain/associated protein EpsI [Paracoccus sp. (in: a-proteobacteria)]